MIPNTMQMWRVITLYCLRSNNNGGKFTCSVERQFFFSNTFHPGLQLIESHKGGPMHTQSQLSFASMLESEWKSENLPSTSWLLKLWCTCDQARNLHNSTSVDLCRVWDSAFLTISMVMLMLVVHGTHLKRKWDLYPRFVTSGSQP